MKKLLLFAAFAYGVNVTQAQTVSTVAGTVGSAGTSVSPNTTIALGKFNNPFGVVVDNAGMIWVTEKTGNRVRLIDVSADGVVIRAGASASTAGFLDGTGINARFSSPKGIAIDGNNNFLVVDEGNNCIRKVTPYTTVGNSQEVSTFAGINTTAGGHNDGALTTAEFSSPAGIAIAPNGDVYIADAQNNCIRKIDTVSQMVTTIAGNTLVPGIKNGHGDTAQFINPTGLLMLDANTLIVTDQGSGLIRSIDLTTRMVSTYASGGFLNLPTGITKDNQNNIYVTDGNQILKISGGVVSVFAGAMAAGSTNGVGAAARFSAPGFITFANNSLYVCDEANHTIRKIAIDNTFVETLGENSVFNLYPNPVNNHFTIDLNDDKATFSLTDISGKVILSDKVVNGKNTFDASQLQSGIYFLQVVNANGSKTSKVVKN